MKSKNFYFFVMIIFVSYMFADVWIYDNTNHDFENDWRANTWQLRYRVNSINITDNSLSPFYSYNWDGFDEIALGESSDFRPEDGWVLFSAFLGDYCDETAPFVILYNKHTGIVRYFFKNRDPLAEHTRAMAGMSSTSNSGILSTITSVRREFLIPLWGKKLQTI